MAQAFCLDDALDAMAAASSLDGMTALLLDLRDTHGLANLVYHAAKLPGCALPNPILVLSYDPAWVKRYITEDYFSIDPVVAAGVRGFLPVDWSRSTEAARPRDIFSVRPTATALAAKA